MKAHRSKAAGYAGEARQCGSERGRDGLPKRSGARSSPKIDEEELIDDSPKIRLFVVLLWSMIYADKWLRQNRLFLNGLMWGFMPFEYRNKK